MGKGGERDLFVMVWSAFKCFYCSLFFNVGGCMKCVCKFHEDCFLGVVEWRFSIFAYGKFVSGVFTVYCP